MTPDSAPTWTDIAPWYDELIRAGSGAHRTALRCLLGLLPTVEGAEVVDVACGQGLATRALVDAGAGSVVGVDSSSTMLELARRHSTGTGTDPEYVEGDAQRLAAFGDRSFDGVTCQLGLMDIPDLDATLAAVRRVLRPGGWFVFVIGHPCILVPGATPVADVGGRAAVQITGYFTERFWRSSDPHGVRRVGNHHRTLSTYLNALIRAGLTTEAVDEPVAGELLARQQPLYSEVPIFFGARAVRT